MEETLGGFRSGHDIVVIAVFGVLLCIARAFVIAPYEEELQSSGLVQRRSDLSGVPSSDEYVCRMKGCLDVAETYLTNMNRSIDPCDNFYKFACGNKSSVYQPGLIKLQLDTQLRTSIELPIQPNEPKPFRLVKNFYKACMNEDANEAQSLKSLRDILNKLGGWPVLSGDRWSDRNFDWKSSIYKVLKAGYGDYLIVFGIGLDLKNTTKLSIYIDHPTFGLSEKYLAKGFDDKYVQEYHNYMVDIAVILGANKNTAMTELKESLLFQMKLVNISMSTERLMKDINLSYNPMTITELKNNYSSIPWTDIFAKLSSGAIVEDEVVIVTDPNYIASLEKLMKVTSKRTLANYVMGRIVHDSVKYMNRDIRARQLGLLPVLQRIQSPYPRWLECIIAVSRQLPLAVGALYVENYFSEEAKTDVVKIVMDIKKQFAKTLRQVKWMDETSRKRTLEKLAAMSSVVAYSDEIVNLDMHEKYYENLELSGENYLETFINCSLFTNYFWIDHLRKPVETWIAWMFEQPVMVNAVYLNEMNTIEIPAGILQGVFFGNDRPKYTNYGGIGHVIGREISRVFDTIGSHFDKDGNFFNLWTTTTKENFDKRAVCLIHQYGNYTVEEVGLKVNGEMTVNENIADNVGIKEAYLAYSDWVLENKPEKQLPGLNYTSNQMFWISVANGFCRSDTKERLRHLITTDYQSPPEWQVVGSLSNMPQFSNDFNCSIDSKMNPIDKCSVW